MFMFMEGLPRSGKSYETCSVYILSALMKGRGVTAYVEGLNHQKFADISGIPLPIVNKLLNSITRDQVHNIHEHARKDDLVVIDELQNFWPSSRMPLNDLITKFITEHGHEGLDIIGMGQDLGDCHKLWRNRCDRKFVFQKQDVVGRDHKYLWTAYKGVKTGRDITFKKIKSGTKEYDPQYFGLYKSHTDGTENFDTFKDDRTNLFKSKIFTLIIPLFICVLIYSIYTLVDLFSITDEQQKALDDFGKVPPTTHYQLSESSHSDYKSLESQFESTRPVPVSGAAEQFKIEEPKNDDYVDSIAQKYRLRLAGSIRSEKGVVIQIDAFDNMMYLKESFKSEELVALGWQIEQKPYGVMITKGDMSHIVRSWPIDIHGRVNATTAQAL